LLSDYLRRHPVAEAQDIYKFTHQSVYGPAHLITNVEGARRYLEREIASLSVAGQGEPLMDVLSHAPPLVRVNLRPFVAVGGDTQALLQALVQSANRVRGDAALMASRLEAAAGQLRQADRGELAGALDAIAAEQAASGFPALHHSQAYTTAYEPAYRVVLLPLVEPALPRAEP
jgi:hypothetical protein